MQFRVSAVTSPVLRIMALLALSILAACAAPKAEEPQLPVITPGYEAVEDEGFFIEAVEPQHLAGGQARVEVDRKSTRLNSSHSQISYSLFFFLMIRRPPRSPLFPSTTLFRSKRSRMKGSSSKQSSRSILPGVRPASRWIMQATKSPEPLWWIPSPAGFTLFWRATGRSAMP